MIIEGKPTKINTNKKRVFEFLSDFNHYERLMPDQIINWESNHDACSFTIKGMTNLALKYNDKIPHHLIDIVPDGKSPISFNLRIELTEDTLNDQNTIAQVKVDANLNPMMAMIAKKPLESLVNIIGEKLNTEFSK